jgi:hypothetical protein
VTRHRSTRAPRRWLQRLRCKARVALIVAFEALFVLSGYASWAAAESDAPKPSAQPIQVDIVRAPENTSERNLVLATWALAGVTVALWLATLGGVRKQSRDMRESIRIAQQSAEAASKSADAAMRSADAAKESADLAARQRREELEREANHAAFKVIATAARVQQLAERVPPALAQLLALSGMGTGTSQTEHSQRKLKLRQERTAEFGGEASALRVALRDNPSDSELTAGLRNMDVHLAHLDLMRQDITDELQSIEYDSRFRREQNAARQLAAGGGTPPPM